MRFSVVAIVLALSGAAFAAPLPGLVAAATTTTTTALPAATTAALPAATTTDTSVDTADDWCYPYCGGWKKD